MCQDTGPCCQRPYQSWPAISRAGDACVAWAKQARQEKVILLTNQQADACARGRVGEFRNSELPGAQLTQTSEVARSASQLSSAQCFRSFGCWKRQQVGCKYGRAERSTAPTLSLLCTWMLPSRSRCCSCTNKFGHRERLALALMSAPDVGYSFGCM